MLSRKESKARRLAVFAIMLDIVTFTLGFGFIFIAIGHDANSSTECNAGNLGTSTCSLPANVCTTTGTNCIQTGSTSCTIAISTQTCSTTGVAFNPAFSSAPNVFSTSISPPTFTTAIYTPGCFVCAMTTWTGMPAAVTEVFGDTSAQHQMVIAGNGVNSGFSAYASWQVFVTCTVGSNTLGALLEVQYSLDSGTTWADLSATAGAGDVIIDNTVCPIFGGVYPAKAGLGFASAVAGQVACQATGPCIVLRVVGKGGGGAGDNPAFTITIVLNANGQLDTLAAFLSITASSMTVRCTAPIKVASATACLVKWRANMP